MHAYINTLRNTMNYKSVSHIPNTTCTLRSSDVHICTYVMLLNQEIYIGHFV